LGKRLFYKKLSIFPPYYGGVGVDKIRALFYNIIQSEIKMEVVATMFLDKKTHFSLLMRLSALFFLVFAGISEGTPRLTWRQCILGGALGMAAVSAGAAYFAYRYHQKPAYIPPLEEKMNIFTLYPTIKRPSDCAIRMRDVITNIHEGLPVPDRAIVPLKTEPCNYNDYLSLNKGVCAWPSSVHPEHLFVYNNSNRQSSSTALGAGALGVRARYKNDLIPLIVPCIGYDYPDDDYRHFDLGRTEELDIVCNKIRTQYPDTQISFMGECGGAFRMLRYAALHPELPIYALVCFSPMPSFNAAIQGAYDSFVRSWRGDVFLSRERFKRMFSFVFPSYDATHDSLITVLHHITGKKIFIAYHVRDILIPHIFIKYVLQELTSRNEVYFFVVDGKEVIPHAYIEIDHKEVRYALNAFYKKINMPYNKEYAEKGKYFLASAAEWAKNPDLVLDNPGIAVRSIPQYT
jgi:hypothetical protein